MPKDFRATEITNCAEGDGISQNSDAFAEVGNGRYFSVPPYVRCCWGHCTKTRKSVKPAEKVSEERDPRVHSQRLNLPQDSNSSGGHSAGKGPRLYVGSAH